MSPLTNANHRRAARTVAVLALLLAVLLPADARAAVTSTVSGGVLSVSSDGGDGIVIACGQGSVTVNGAAPGTGPAPCSAITAVRVAGGPANNTIDLGGVTPAAFPALGPRAPGGASPVSADGLAGADSLTGSALDDTLTGFAGDDMIEAGGGDDIVGEETGEAGADVLRGGAGVDSVQGGEGADMVFGGDGDDALGGGRGGDQLFGQAGRDQLTGGTGSDSLAGGGEDDILRGDPDFFADAAAPDNVAGDDSFDGGPGTDSVFSTVSSAGGPSNLTLTDTQLTGAGSDQLTSIEAADLTGGTAPNTLDATGFSGRATLKGNPGPDTLLGGAGNDELVGGGESDTLRAGAGGDRLTGDVGPPQAPGDDELEGGPGDDAIDGQGGSDRVVGVADAAFTLTDLPSAPNGDRKGRLTGLGTDELTNVERAKLTGGAGDNVLDASSFAGATIFTGGAGADSFRGGPGVTDRVAENGDVDFVLTPAVLSGLGTDSLSGIEGAGLTGGPSANSLNASAFGGPVMLEGGGGADELTGGSAGDTLTGQTGDDSLVGGGGIDTLVESAAPNLTLADATLVGQGTDAVTGIEAAVLLGDGGANTIDASGTTRAVVLVGGPGNDVLLGGSGVDNLSGEADDDRLTGGGGTDTLSGGIGADELRGEEGGDQLDGSDGNDLLDGGAGVDELAAGAGDDSLSGDTGDDDLSGSVGDDTIDGGEGADDLSAGLGDDLLRGGPGDDALSAASGNDDLQGGDGNDELDGGGGVDAYAGGSGEDRILARDEVEETSVACGPDADSAVADLEDVVNADCEMIDKPPSGSTPTPTPPRDDGGGARVRPNLVRPRASAVQGGGRSSARARLSQSGSRIVVRVSGRMLGNRGRPCGGRIKIGTRAGRRTVATRTARMAGNCRYTSRYSVPARRLPKRLRPRNRALVIQILVRYQGNRGLTGDLSPPRRVKVRR